MLHTRNAEINFVVRPLLLVKNICMCSLIDQFWGPLKMEKCNLTAVNRKGYLLCNLQLHYRYQISWTTEVKHAKTGDHEVNLFDEEGYTAAKRAIESGEESAVKPLVTIVVNYPGAYKGPWINSELLAAALSILVFYLAYSSKSALLA